MRNYPKRPNKYHRPHNRERPAYNPHASSDGFVPDARTRAQAQKNIDKYLGMARDASSSGDRVLAEHYFQHADHYHRVAHAGLPSPKTHPTPSSDDQAPTIIDVEAEPISSSEDKMTIDISTSSAS